MQKCNSYLQQISLFHVFVYYLVDYQLPTVPGALTVNDVEGLE